MITYQVMATVPADISDAWEAWMRDHHVPDVVRTGCFETATFSRVRMSAHAWTHVIRYATSTRERLDAYLSEHAPRLRADHDQRFGSLVTTERLITDTLSEYRL